MKILLFGKNGQVGWELQRSLAPLGEVVALDRHSTEYNGIPVSGDFLKPDALASTVLAVQPDVIVNAAAYTAVDQAESDAANAHTINAMAPISIAQAATKIGALLVHYSTDYVFDGTPGAPWVELDAPRPLSVYGASKLAGEQGIAASGARHFIFRTSWVYAARGGNFAKTMLRLAKERQTLSVINDQTGAPTGAELLADVTAHVLRSALHTRPNTSAPSGIYHLAAAGSTTWYGYAQHIFATARKHGVALKLDDALLKAISTLDYPTAAQRPLNSALNCEKLRSGFNLNLPHWTVGVDRMLAETL
jgi:dTDP-4-dehydrorhamnose reductase